jgi:hypothetical protein
LHAAINRRYPRTLAMFLIPFRKPIRVLQSPKKSNDPDSVDKVGGLTGATKAEESTGIFGVASGGTIPPHHETLLGDLVQPAALHRKKQSAYVARRYGFANTFGQQLSCAVHVRH